MLSTENTTNAKKIVEGTCDVTRVASQRKRLTVARVPGKVDDVNTVRVVKKSNHECRSEHCAIFFQNICV